MTNEGWLTLRADSVCQPASGESDRRAWHTYSTADVETTNEVILLCLRIVDHSFRDVDELIPKQ